MLRVNVQGPTKRWPDGCGDVPGQVTCHAASSCSMIGPSNWMVQGTRPAKPSVDILSHRWSAGGLQSTASRHGGDLTHAGLLRSSSDMLGSPGHLNLHSRTCKCVHCTLKKRSHRWTKVPISHRTASELPLTCHRIQGGSKDNSV